MEPLFWVCKSLGGDLSSLNSIGFWSKGPACLITAEENRNTYTERRFGTESFGCLVNVSQVTDSEDIVDYVKRFLSICKSKARYPKFITASELMKP